MLSSGAAVHDVIELLDDDTDIDVEAAPTHDADGDPSFDEPTAEEPPDGMPHDDAESIRENYEFVRELGITSVMDQLLTNGFTAVGTIIVIMNFVDKYAGLSQQGAAAKQK